MSTELKELQKEIVKTTKNNNVVINTNLEPLLLTIKDVATLFSVTRQTVARWMREEPDFPQPIILKSKNIRFKYQDIKEYVNNLN